MSYLKNLIKYYHDGAYLDTNLDLACQQAGMDRLSFLGRLMEEGIMFQYKPVFFKNDGNLIHVKSMDIIIMSKTGFYGKS